MIFHKYPGATFVGAALTGVIYGGVLIADCFMREHDNLSDVPRGAAVVPVGGWATTGSVSLSQGAVSIALPDMTGDATIEVVHVADGQYVVVGAPRRAAVKAA
jgi:hypothetical protein